MIKKISLFNISYVLLIVLSLGLFFNKAEAYRYTIYQGNNSIDVQNYKIEIQNINRSTQEVDFITTITAKTNRSIITGEWLALDFIDTYQISEVLFNGQNINSGDYKITYTGTVALSGINKKLEINTPFNINLNGDISIKVTYRGVPKLDIDSSGLGFYKTGTELHAFNEPLGAHQRFPCSDVPGDKATLDMYVTTVTNKVIVGNGKLIYDTDHGNGTHTVYRKEKYPISTYNVYIGVGPYNYIYSGTSQFLSGSQNILGYSTTNNTTLSNKINNLSTSTGMMKQMIDIFGPYPFADEKFGVILRPINNYMEHTTIIGMYTVANDGLFRHELIHQWLGNLVTMASWQDLWITEAGGVYFPQVSKVGKNNREEASYGLNRTMDRTRALNNPLDTNLFSTNLVYTRAAWIYHHLRSYLGNDVYLSGLNYYINKYAHGTVNTQKFKETWEESSNINLSGFFNRFVYGTGSPIIQVTSFYDNVNSGTYSGRALFKLSRADNKNWTPDVVFAKINYSDGSSGEFRIFQEDQNNYLQINTPKNISGIIIDPGSGSVNRQTDYPGTIYSSGFSIQNDNDTDGLPDGWEYIMFGNLNQTAMGDYNNNGILNINEYNLILDTIPPIGTISYSTTGATSGNVIATISLNETGTITNNGGSSSYTFTSNGSFTFEFRDELGNTGSSTATVTWIDTIPPIGTISYSTTGATSGNVIATISLNETGTITNNGGSSSYTFTSNGSFTFEFIDLAGNTGNVTATVNNIDSIPIIDRSKGAKRNMKDSCPDGDYSPSYYDHTCWENIVTTGISQNIEISKEIIRAYMWSYSKGITSMKTLGLARLQDTATRAETAKMIVQYAIKELKRIPDTGFNCIFRDVNGQNTEIQSYIKLACQLNIMGINNDKTIKTKFAPDDEITRAEFGTIISRLLYKNINNDISPNKERYDKHLEILNKEKIINDISKPYNKEIRGYMMLIIQRIDNLIKIKGLGYLKRYQ